MAKWTEWMPRVLVESVLIVFSILLALVLDEWRQEREEAARAREAQRAFATEIRRNREMLVSEQYLPTHRRMRERYDGLWRLDRPTQSDVGRVWSEFPQGVNFVRLNDAVWRSFSRGDVLARMPLRQLVVLADIYRQQEEVEAFNRGISDAWRVASAEWADPAYVRDDIRRTRSYLGDVIGAEERLLRLYDGALAELAPAAEPPR